ncbi:MAG TPA: AsnC family transcriptional regulator [Syntrophomonadaceae bacterium]|nr:AsnC family transcriptional regulator [Syntrophomonadaceae bacterium]
MGRAELDQVDRALLNRIQENFPLTARPYQELALNMDLPEEEVITRLQRLKDSGVIRRIGAVFDSSHMGYFSTLCACQVPEERIDEVAAIITRESGVTHNYQRDHTWNLWFTLTAPGKKTAQQIISRLERDTGVAIENMPTTKVYKIKVSFEIGGTDVL